MHQIYIQPSSIENNSIIITDTDKIRHLRSVLRVKSGDNVECFDGQGRKYKASIKDYDNKRVVLEILEQSIERQVITPIALAAAVIKPGLFEQIIRSASELGAEAVVPLTTERTVIRGAQIENKLARWRKIATESAEQCRRSRLMKVECVQSLKSYLMTQDDSFTLMATCSQNSVPIAEKLSKIAKVNHITLLIGPEGDFSPNEIKEAIKHGVHPVSMGALTLRSETAAITALSIVRYSLGFK